MLDYDELTEYDFKILNHLYNSPNMTAHVSSIYSLFKNKESTDVRLHQLSVGIKDSSGFFYKENTQYICFDFEHYTDNEGFGHSKKLDTLHITPLGVKALEEYLTAKHKQSLKIIEERIWKACPIMLAFLALYVSVISFLQSIGIVHAEQWLIVQSLLKVMK